MKPMQAWWEEDETERTYQDKIIDNFIDGSIYIGEVDSKGTPHGYGIWILSDSSLYQGYSFSGYANGNGRLIYVTSDGLGGVTTAFYEGEFDQDKPNGPGFETLG